LCRVLLALCYDMGRRWLDCVFAGVDVQAWAEGFGFEVLSLLDGGGAVGGDFEFEGICHVVGGLVGVADGEDEVEGGVVVYLHVVVVDSDDGGGFEEVGWHLVAEAGLGVGAAEEGGAVGALYGDGGAALVVFESLGVDEDWHAVHVLESEGVAVGLSSHGDGVAEGVVTQGDDAGVGVDVFDDAFGQVGFLVAVAGDGCDGEECDECVFESFH